MQSRQPVDLLIEARWVLPIEPPTDALSQHAVAIEAGRIVAVGPTPTLRARFEAREHVVRDGHVLLPGLVNAYARTASVLERNQASSERTADFVRDGTLLALGQMLRAGITCFGDDNAHAREVARIAASSRVRAVIGLPVAESASRRGDAATAHLAQAELLWDEYRANPFVCLQFAPTGSELSDATLTRIRTVADELDARIVMPVHESADAVRAGLACHGSRPLRRLHDLGLLRPGFTALHMTMLDEHDLELTARTGVAVIAAPQASLRVQSALAPLDALLARGISIGLGSGADARAGALDILAEARAAALHARLEPAVALRLATLGGARALGLGASIGSLESGKAADIIAVDVSALSSQALSTPAESLIFAATREHVTDVWIGGRAAVSRGRLLAFDEGELALIAQRWDRGAESAGEAQPLACAQGMP